MSEFECRHGHLVRFGEDCKACEAEGRFGERAFYMDGLSSAALRKKERYEEGFHDYNEAEEEEDAQNDSE